MLTARHFFPFLRMVRAMELKESLKNLAKLLRDAEDITEEQGIDLIWDLFIEGLPKAEHEAYEFLAVYSNKSKDELEQLPIEELFELFKQLLAEPQLKHFLSRASNLKDQPTPTT